MFDYPIVCHTLLPDNRELVLANLADESCSHKILNLGDYRFKAFIEWDRCSTEARIGFLAHNSKYEIRLFWIIWSQPFVKTSQNDVSFLRIE